MDSLNNHEIPDFKLKKNQDRYIAGFFALFSIITYGIMQIYEVGGRRGGNKGYGNAFQ